MEITCEQVDHRIGGGSHKTPALWQWGDAHAAYAIPIRKTIDAGVLAGLPENGVKLSADLWTLSANADGILDFTVPAATIANVAIAAERGLGVERHYRRPQDLAHLAGEVVRREPDRGARQRDHPR